MSSVHPQRYQGFDPTHAQGINHIILYTRGDLPEMHGTNVAIFWRITIQAHPKSRTCSSSRPHLMGRSPGRPVKTRGRPHGHGGHRSSSSSTRNLVGSGPGRPVKTHGPPHGPGGAAHIEPTSHGPRPGPAHQISRGWAATRPGPSNFQRMGRRPARSIKISEDGPRPDPAHHIFDFPGPARPGPSIFQKSRPGPARPRQTPHGKP